VVEFEGLVRRIRAEFEEMPGLQLTLRQAARLWGMDPGSCQAVVDALIGTSFLRWTAMGTIARVDD
jgi:hypothetical protein